MASGGRRSGVRSRFSRVCSHAESDIDSLNAHRVDRASGGTKRRRCIASDRDSFTFGVSRCMSGRGHALHAQECARPLFMSTTPPDPYPTTIYNSTWCPSLRSRYDASEPPSNYARIYARLAGSRARHAPYSSRSLGYCSALSNSASSDAELVSPD